MRSQLVVLMGAPMGETPASVRLAAALPPWKRLLERLSEAEVSERYTSWPQQRAPMALLSSPSQGVSKL